MHRASGGLPLLQANYRSIWNLQKESGATYLNPGNLVMPLLVR